MRIAEETGRIVPRWADWPDDPGPEYVVAEAARCRASAWHFVTTYCSVYQAGTFSDSDADLDDSAAGGGDWVRFELWPSQVEPLQLLQKKRKLIFLKARQLGATWFCLAHGLRRVTLFDNVTLLLFSKGDRESMDLMRRIQGMFRRLPPWLVPEGSYTKGRLSQAAGHSWTLPNGSRVMSFPSSAGDSYSASHAIIDEADLVPDLNKLLESVKPTTDNGGQLVLLSRADKSKPESAFKNIFRAAMQGENGWTPHFLPWYAHPERTRKWYNQQVRHSMKTTFSLDYAWGQYPNNPEEALAARQLDKRFPAGPMMGLWRDSVDYAAAGTLRPELKWREYEERVVESWRGGRTHYETRFVPTHPKVLRALPAPAIPNLRLYKLPRIGREYTIGADPAQGLPQSHDSAAVVVDDATGEEVACFWGKIAPKPFARYLAELCGWFRAVARCRLMCERNNHGHAVILAFREYITTHFEDAGLALGPDGGVGWNQGEQSSELMFHRAAQMVAEKQCLIRTRAVYDQVCDLESETLHAPEGRLDDLAYAWGLAMAAASLKRRMTFQ